jgi:hypothetical protein
LQQKNLYRNTSSSAGIGWRNCSKIERQNLANELLITYEIKKDLLRSLPNFVAKMFVRNDAIDIHIDTAALLCVPSQREA